MADTTTIARIVTDLDNIHLQYTPLDPPPLISESTLLDLQTLLDKSFNSTHSETMECFYDELLLKNVSVLSLVGPISCTMDSGAIRVSLLASNVFLSLLLSPNAPVLTLFTPMAFFSLLRCVRQSLKHRPEVLVQPGDEGSTVSLAPTKRRRKGGGRGKGLRNGVRRLCNDVGESEFDVRDLFSVLERLELVLGLIHLDRFPDSLRSLLQTVTEIPVLALELCGNSDSFSRLTNLCSQILCGVLRPDHGDQANTAAEVLKSLSSLILLVRSPAKTFAMEFVTDRMMSMAKESDGIKKAMLNLPRYLVQKAPLKSEPRTSAVESILGIVRAMEYEDQIGFTEYVGKMSQGNTNLRLLAVDLILMLMMSLKDPMGLDLKGEDKDLWGLRCLNVLLQRCSDSNAAIRARALSNLAQLVGFLSGDSRSRALLKEVMGFDNEEHHNPNGGINDFLRKRCMDEKAAVRKATLHLVTKLTALQGRSFDGLVLKTIGMACSDPLVSIRKAAISALSEAFRTFSDENVTTEWLHSVPRLITDNESSIQEECETLFLELVLDRVARAGSGGLPHNGHSVSNPNVKAKDLERDLEFLFPEGVLGLLKEICNGVVTPWVKKICSSLGKKRRLKPTISIALQNIIKTSEALWLSHSMPIENWTAPPGAWFLLSEVSAHLSKTVDWEFLHRHWQLLDKHGAGGELKSSLVQGDVHEEEVSVESNSAAWAGDRVFLLQTISNVSVELPPEPAADLAHNLLKRIEEFNMHSTEVNAHVRTLRSLCKRKAASPEEANTLVMKWVQQLLLKASQILERYTLEDSKANKDDSFLTPPARGSRKSKRAATASRLLLQAMTAIYTIGSLVLVCPSANVNTIIPVLHTVITSGNSGPKLNKLPSLTMSLKEKAPSFYIQAWLTMGKICLADGKLAKRYIPLFVQELEKSDCAALRNNLVVIMTDFCVRYTALVDCYIIKITRCLRDPCELVRRQTFILLSRLLQRDYVKWRGVLFLRFLLSLVDESEKIRQLADYLFGNILKAKAPLLAYNSFMESIFVLNDCHAHNFHSESQSARNEALLFSIRGNDESSRSKRMHIYVSLLKQMAPEHLLATFAKLCAEILAAVSDGMLNIEDITGQSVLQDTFQILACKEIRILPNRVSTSDPAQIDEEGGDSSAARGRAITQAVRKGLIQNTIPIFIELKRLLESKNSPLTGSLMECLRILLKDYKNEIDDILVADKQLQKELIYDMQKYEAAKAKSTATEAIANMQKSNSYSTPGGVSKAATGIPSQNMQNDKKVASAIADAAAAATVRSVLKEVNKGGALTPPLSSIRPKLKSTNEGVSQVDRPLHVIESLRRRQSFDSEDEN